MKTLLSIQNIRLKLGVFEFQDLSLDVADGEYLVLMGPSGCGKTTLLKVVAGLIEPHSGSVFINGTHASDLPCHLRRVAYVPQNASLFPHLSVLKNIEFGVRYSTQPEQATERIHELAQMLDISSLLNRMPNNLSGGEAKRVALARALATNPLVLLLDEPLGMLDKPARDETADFLRKLHDRLGTATIHVTHDRDEANRLNTNCAVMFDGRIEQAGSFNNLLAHPNSIKVANFLGVKNIHRVTVVSVGGASVFRTPFGDFESAETQTGTGLVRFPPEHIKLNNIGEGDWRVDSISPNGLVADIEIVHKAHCLSVQLLREQADRLTIGMSVSVVIPSPIVLSETFDNA